MADEVIQIVIPKIGGQPRPISSGQITTLANARAIIAANHTAALGLGYSSTLHADDNSVEYTAPFDPPVRVKQLFWSAGRFFKTHSHPLTGPAPQLAAVAAPAIGAGTERLLSYGQSNMDRSGSGRYTAGGLTFGLGSGGVFTTCSDPLPGAVTAESDAGPLTRLAYQALGQIALNGSTINRVIVASRSEGGTNIEYWAEAGTFAFTSTASLAVGTGAKTFTAIAANRKVLVGDVLKAVSAGTPSATMTLAVTSYNSGTGVLTGNVFAVTGAGTHADWSLDFLSAGGGYSNARAALLDVNATLDGLLAGAMATKVLFAQGEANARATDWTQADVLQSKWQLGFASFESGLRAAPFGTFTAPVYVAETCVCDLRDAGTVGGDLDSVLQRTPDHYVEQQIGREAIRRAQRAVVNGSNIRRGPVLDSIGPVLRATDGCHFSELGNVEAARRWRIALYGG